MTAWASGEKYIRDSKLKSHLKIFKKWMRLQNVKRIRKSAFTDHVAGPQCPGYFKVTIKKKRYLPQQFFCL
jgi:hypothetical protein